MATGAAAPASPSVELKQAVVAGRPVRRGAGEDAGAGATWGPDREVPADLLAELLTQLQPPAARAVVLVGLRVIGDLNLETAKLHTPFLAHGCWFERPINLCGATATAVRLTGCHIPGVAADQLRLDGDLDLSNSAVEIVSVQHARIGGSLLLPGATLTEGTVPIDLGDGTLRPRESVADTSDTFALNAQGARIDGDLRGTGGFRSEGSMCLSRARIGGLFHLSEATVAGDVIAEGIEVEGDLLWRTQVEVEGRVSLIGSHVRQDLTMEGTTVREMAADRLRVDASMFLQEGFECASDLRLPASSIGGELALERATVKGELCADRLQVADSLFLWKGFRAESLVQLCGAKVGGLLSLEDATLAADDTSLDLDGACVKQDLVLQFAARPAGTIDLTNASAKRIRDSEATWPPRLLLEHCEYEVLQADEDRVRTSPTRLPRKTWHAIVRLLPTTPADVRRRFRWIGLSQASDGYSPGPYTQLMDVYRRHGRDTDARRVGYERERRRASSLRPAGKAWNAFLRWTVGYGYRPLRAAGLLLMLVVVGSLAFSSFHDDGALVPRREGQAQFVAAIYTLDRLIPVVSFGLRDAYIPHGAAQWWAFAYTLLGWALTVAVLAGLNAAVRRE